MNEKKNKILFIYITTNHIKSMVDSNLKNEETQLVRISDIIIN